MCIKTFSEARSMHDMLADRQPVSTAAMHKEQDDTIIPNLAELCGALQDCVGCTVRPQRLAVEGVVARAAQALSPLDLV